MSIIVNEDAAHTCISDLGKLGMIQFTDLNPELTAFQRRYVAYIKRIDELERKLAFFGEEVRAVIQLIGAQDYVFMLATRLRCCCSPSASAGHSSVFMTGLVYLSPR